MRLVFVLVALAVTLAGCSSPQAGSPKDPDQPGGGPAVVHSVQEGDDNVFDPPTLVVRAGTTVAWDVVGEGHHRVDFLVPIDASGSLPKSPDLGPGDEFSVTFAEPGSFKYYCKYHSNKESGMIGVIVVEA